MARHSHWHNIQLKKGAADKKRGAIFTRHARLIQLAARESGADLSSNATLRAAVEKARADNVPNANIERAIAKGTGTLEGVTLQEVMYEGYGPGGTAFYVEVVTDNKNRSVADIRMIFENYGGRLGENGCTAWMFSKKGILTVDLTPATKEMIELTAIDGGAEDVRLHDNFAEIITAPQDMKDVKKAFETAGIPVKDAEVAFVAQTEKTVTEPETAQKILTLVDDLEEYDDVVSVAGNFAIPDAVMRQFD